MICDAYGMHGLYSRVPMPSLSGTNYQKLKHRRFPRLTIFVSQARRQQQNWLCRCCPCLNSKYSSKRSLRTSSSTHTTLSSSTVHHSQVPKRTVYNIQVQNSSSSNSGTEMQVIFCNSTSSPLWGTERPLTITTEQSSKVYITHGVVHYLHCTIHIICHIWSWISKVSLASMWLVHSSLGSYTRALLVSQDGRHLFVTP
jgi:hypothetical protein